MSNFNDLTRILTDIDSESEMTNFLNGLLTPKEREEFVRRLDIIKMLKKGMPQHTIAEKLGVGVATVTRGSKEIQMGRFKNIA
ncbi:transcriptional regulator [Candidatus Roizmanbacteria bacterium CG_4_10_14_0_2_um_filter_39_13]|uniref:Transcriptional regulator n=1 Tax=Candidatus Roizmanbacteria bacterium CG_4_10_14_0_2_um_filter_39_13 TaxID=1974825 RepID=A0A2M7U0S5_9BACT|nr:MAG: transcriptional regulator [Candidatus Roizmanbacteria bacterium CG_4_10_14_0_2_um_filter_39_13]